MTVVDESGKQYEKNAMGQWVEKSPSSAGFYTPRIEYGPVGAMDGDRPATASNGEKLYVGQERYYGGSDYGNAGSGGLNWLWFALVCLLLLGIWPIGIPALACFLAWLAYERFFLWLGEWLSKR